MDSFTLPFRLKLWNNHKNSSLFGMVTRLFRLVAKNDRWNLHRLWWDEICWWQLFNHQHNEKGRQHLESLNFKWRPFHAKMTDNCEFSITVIMVIENLIDHSFMNWMNNGHFDKKKSFWSYKGHSGHTTAILIKKVILVIHRSFWWWSKYHFGHKLHCHFGHTTAILVKKGTLKKLRPFW